MLQDYTLNIGLEIHTQLKTESKIFCADANRFGAPANTLVSPVSLGHPGSLPVFNEKVAQLAVKLGLALGCQIREWNFFDRKNYFYPDLPKGYQITQDKAPICMGGAIPFRGKDGSWKSLRLNRIHMEEDAGKSVHLDSDAETGLDLNRAGVPLLEIVTEPELDSAQDAAACLMEVRRLVRFLDVGDGNMEEGSFRCDANISVRKKSDSTLGKKVEIKNMNSFRHVQKAIEYEFDRQVKRLESGEEIVAETRMFSVASGETYGMRNKETLNDYRYFPDPDLAPLQLTSSFIDPIRKSMPELPANRMKRYESELCLSEKEARFLTEEKEITYLFEDLLTAGISPKIATNWLMGPVQNWRNSHESSLEWPFKVADLVRLIAWVETKKLSHGLASQQVFQAMCQLKGQELEAWVTKEGLWNQSDGDDEVRKQIEEVLRAFPEKVADYRKGKKALLGMFMGEVRKRIQKPVDPKALSEMLEEMLRA
jgi:aspartyl-tRNA(Asn)/glutamyl-tRNA(Gln) amidotransferase subunit B